MTNINTLFTQFANKNFDIYHHHTKHKKTQKEEVKELLQNPEDPLAKYPLRGFGYANEIGAAVSAMPGWGKTAEALLWVPALMYLGADIFDKYSRGKDGNYSQASVNKAVEQATFQALASVILPTAAVKMGQKIAGYATKYDGSHLVASAQEELYRKILDDFDKGKFAKSDLMLADGTTKKGVDRVLEKILNEDFDKLLQDTSHDLRTEGVWSKIKRFFSHTKRPISCASADRNHVDNFVKKKVTDIFDMQSKLENLGAEGFSGLDSKTQRHYRKALKNIDNKVSQLFRENPSFILKKLLNNNEEALETFRKTVLSRYQGDSLKLLLKNQKESAKLLTELMGHNNGAEALTKFAKKIKIARDTLRPIIKAQEMKLGWLKTAGGFAALACLAIPIDHFVHKYIIQHAVAPALEKVEQTNKNFKKKVAAK